MAIEFTCPACGGTLRARDAAVGQVVRCGGCMTMLRVPDAEPSPPSDPTNRTPEIPASRTPPSARSDPDFPDPADSPLRPIRGTRFWLMVTAATLGLGTCACCGLAVLVLPGPQWRTYESERGGFRVELPADPRDDLGREFQVRQGKTVEGAHLWTRAEYYTVTYWDRTAGVRKSDGQVLDEYRKALDANAEVRKVTRDDEIEVGGFPAREFEYQGRRGGTYTGRVIVTNKRVYVLLAGGRFTEPDNENVRQFLDSFQFTDPQLVTEGEQRRDLAAQGREQLRQRQSREEVRAAAAEATAAALAAAEAELDRNK